MAKDSSWKTFLDPVIRCQCTETAEKEHKYYYIQGKRQIIVLKLLVLDELNKKIDNNFSRSEVDYKTLFICLSYR